MHTRLTFILAISIVVLAGCGTSHRYAAASAIRVQPTDVPAFPVGSSIEDVSRILKESQADFAPKSKRIPFFNAKGTCILTHQFTTQYGDDCIICMSGKVLGLSPHYFIFANESLQKVVRSPARLSTLDPPADPWERMDVVLNAAHESQAAIVANVQEDLERFERGTRHFEPNPALIVSSMLFPPRNRKPEVEASHDILQWRPGDTADRMDQVYGGPLRIVSLDHSRSARLYTTKAACGGYIAAIFTDGSLETVFSHDFFDPRFWLDLLGEKHSPPWNGFEILRQR